MTHKDRQAAGHRNNTNFRREPTHQAHKQPNVYEKITHTSPAERNQNSQAKQQPSGQSLRAHPRTHEQAEGSRTHQPHLGKVQDLLVPLSHTK